MFPIIIFIILFLILLYLYYYVKIESFDSSDTETTNAKTTIPQTTIPTLTMSSQIMLGISTTLGISQRRISNLSYIGDVSTGTLSVSFTILEPNIIEFSKKEPNASDAAKMANNLFTDSLFVVNINDKNINLNKINQSSVNNINNNVFDNTGLKDIANYANNKYISVPNESSLTNFYKLDFDKNFNIIPTISA
uniref:Uncharacterized protein n=1 Tax=viral metagenome TaxID=1070528 RepID=A0A6C0F4G0_9ZZZZ